MTQIDQLQNILGMQTVSEDQKEELAHLVNTGEVDIPSEY